MKRKILIVEDNLINQVILKTLLQKHNYEVDIADNGSIALEILNTCRPDAILMDLNMPVMNGYECTEAIRKLNNPLKDLPIIAVTAELHPDTELKVLNVGMNGYIPKPVDIEKLLGQIEALLAQSNGKHTV